MSPVSTQTAQHLRKWLAAIDSGEVSVVNDPADIPALREMVAALARQEEGREAVYQCRPKAFAPWTDCDLETYNRLPRDQYDVRILYRHPAPPSAGEGDAYTFAMIEEAWGDTVPLVRSRFDQFRKRLAELRNHYTPTPQAAGDEGRVGEMTPERACYFLRRFKADEKMLGPNEQWALDFAIERCTPTPQAAGVSEAVETIKRIAAQLAVDDCEGDAADLIDALHDLTAAGAAPEGFVLVPMKATNNMQIAGLSALDDSDATPPSIGHQIGYRAIRELWTAMLAAAPQTGAQHGQEGRDHG